MRKSVQVALIMLLCAVAYTNTLDVPLQWDGKYFIAENPAIRDFSYFMEPSQAKGTDFYQAIRMRWAGYLSFALNYRVHGLDVTGYHIVNILIHMLNSILLFVLITGLLRTPALRNLPPYSSSQLALFSALLFAVHPIQTEAVTYIFQRLASLAALFYLGAIVSYVWSRLPGPKRTRTVWFALSILLSVLAMKTKEHTFTLPFIVLLIEIMFFRESVRRRILLLAPFALVLLIIPLSLLGNESSPGEIIASLERATHGYKNVSRPEYLLTQSKVIVEYLRLWVLPVGQNIDHFVAVETSFFSPRVLFSFTLLAALLTGGAPFLVLSRGGRRPLLRLAAFGVFWFFLTLSIESSIIPLPMLMAEYRMYLPSAGLFLAAASLVHHLLPAQSAAPARRAVLTALALLVIIYTGTTLHRNNVWRSGPSLWTDVVSKNPMSAKGYNNLGLILMNSGENDTAVELFRKAISLSPAYADPYNNLGIALGNKGLPRQAIEQYRKALSLDPSLYKTHNNLGNAFRDLGMTQQAISNYRTATDLNPSYAEAHNNLGVAYAKKGESRKAEEHFRLAISFKPELTGARMNLAISLLEQGRRNEGRRELEELLKASPSDQGARELLEIIDQEK